MKGQGCRRLPGGAHSQQRIKQNQSHLDQIKLRGMSSCDVIESDEINELLTIDCILL